MNFYDKYDWETILSLHPKENYDIQKYHQILSPDYPEFLPKYTNLPILQRLDGIGLLCGTDFTPLYKNRFYYSRLAHSIGVSLIVWNFTKDKKQTIAGLLHDISTSVFSHVTDFRKGDALTQTITEAPTSKMIRNNKELMDLLKKDGLTPEEVENYHIYPIADNEIPQLSADRLEYMFPSGMALEGSWTLEQIQNVYSNIKILTNEKGIDELGFCSKESAELYCEKFCMTGHILQLNENKLTLQLLGEIMNKSVEEGILHENDFMILSESAILQKMDSFFQSKNLSPKEKSLFQLYKTFRTMTKIKHTKEPLANHYCVSLNVKQRYINPLVHLDSAKKAVRLSEISLKAKNLINDFLLYKDTEFGCVELSE